MTNTSNSRSTSNWSDLPFDLLLYIISMVSLTDKLTVITEVCKSWRAAVASDMESFKTLDIRKMRQYLELSKPGVHNFPQLTLAYVRALELGGSNVTKLVFDAQFQVSDNDLQYAYERCPNLRELAITFPNKTTSVELKKAFQFWPNLESLSIEFTTYFHPPETIFHIVGIHCLNLRTLEFSCCVINKATLHTITDLMPRLKVLRVRRSMVMAYVDDVVESFSKMPSLEEVYVSILKYSTVPKLPDYQDLPAKIEEGRSRNGLSGLRVFHACYCEECKCDLDPET
ncbi:OLC1v1000742C1 [Oldenlandia corymbosa var. corymbosa]|uniref:OLC1v1000742C1 n=1 Tax=Oldenlandia corymbosa var. corymbosa TaxID=529605 RepID=A0AAV1D3K1_OLDCO|nr:OLC1v1000742C1 [Oldenlandia corymbosa var. corymbosa]